MPHKRRCYVPGYPAHVIQRGNARQAVFFDSDDYQFYLYCLREGMQRYGCAIHAYVLMTNHVHLLLTPTADDSISRVIQHVGRKYVTHINRKYKRSGTLWEGRHKGTVVNCDGYALRCSRYIELNPVRAGMVRDPLEYRWSSYARNAFGDGGEWLVELDGYCGLAASPAMRQAAYRRFFEGAGSVDEIDEIRAHVQTGTPLGRGRFRNEIEVMLGRKTGQSRRGRPKIKGTDPFSTLFELKLT